MEPDEFVWLASILAFGATIGGCLAVLSVVTS